MKSKKLAVLAVLALCVVLAVASAGCTGNNNAGITGSVTVLAADTLVDPMDDLEIAFDNRYVNADLTVEYGDSGILAAGLIAGTVTADVYIADNTDDAQAVVDAGLAKEYAVFATKDVGGSTIKAAYTLMKASEEEQAPLTFVTLLKGGDCKAIFKYYGYTVDL